MVGFVDLVADVTPSGRVPGLGGEPGGLQVLVCVLMVLAALYVPRGYGGPVGPAGRVLAPSGRGLRAGRGPLDCGGRGGRVPA